MPQSIHHILMEKGVILPCPQSVEIGDTVNPDQIAAGATLHAGSKIYGADTVICAGAVIGYEAPATVQDCCVGPDAALKGGFFKRAVFLKGAEAGSGAQVREGTIFEEYAGAAHSVGVKQTILFPFVTLGSLINFCDCLMAGGTHAKNHSEVGSAYIHFNFTPQQDKATASLIGDVASGVMINQAPIFLGGQGGLVGPCRLAYGTVIAAGTVHRKDETRPGRLIFGGPTKPGNVAFAPAMYRNVKRVVYNNLYYIANLIALRQWYLHVRSRFISEAMPQALYDGLQKTLSAGIAERLRQMRTFSEKMPESARVYQETAGEKASQPLLNQKNQLYQKWPELESRIHADAGAADFDADGRGRFLTPLQSAIDSRGQTDYIAVIQSLDRQTADTGTAWLQNIVNERMNGWLDLLPAFSG
ncbi:MAG: protein GlmU [Thermodesulfobacteriota bacterium]